MYRLPSTGDWGGRGQFLDAAFDKAGDMWVVRRDWGANVLQKISGLSQEHAKPELKESTEAKDAAPKLVNIHTAPRRWEPLKELEGIDTPLNIYYGDIHGHTRMSDGVGDVDEYFYTRRDYYEDDFAALTDHDNFVRLPIFPSGWEYQKALMKHFNNPGRFVTVFSQESTTARYPRAYGHKNIYGLNEDMKLLDHTMPEYNTSQKMNKAVKEMNALIFPHHTGWIGTDWENADEEIQTLAEICSNHGVFEFPGNKPITHRGNVKGCFIQDGLARGLKFGLIGGSDSHGLIWHHHAGWKRDCNRTGLAAVLAPELTPEAILDAMRKRRTFATTGIKVRVDFRVNNHLMGSEFESADGKLEISADLAGREDIKWATVVKDNEDLYIYGGDGYTTRFTIDDEIPADGKWHYYYLRVEYEGPEMAWSSPIWVKRSA
jgi:hypothetical protein